MNTSDQIETFMGKKSDEKVIRWLQANEFKIGEHACETGGSFSQLVKNKRSTDGFSWRGYRVSCKNFQKYIQYVSMNFLEEIKYH